MAELIARMAEIVALAVAGRLGRCKEAGSADEPIAYRDRITLGVAA